MVEGGGCVVLVGVGAQPCGEFPINSMGLCGRHVTERLQRCPCGTICEMGAAWTTHRMQAHGRK